MSLYDNRPSLNPKLNAFDLSHNHFTTMDFGLLYPVMYQECVPGDMFQCDYQSLIRALPLVSPILNNMTCTLNAFFVPQRILWDNWEKFFTTIDQTKIPPESFNDPQPVFGQHDDYTFDDVTLDLGRDALWQHFGLNTKLSDTVKAAKLNDLKDYLPTDWIRRGYYSIWNNWFRDENFQEPIDFKNTSNQKLLRRAWRKDYFTSSLYSRQKGASPSLPLTGTGSAVFSDANLALLLSGTAQGQRGYLYSDTSNSAALLYSNAGGLVYNGTTTLFTGQPAAQMGTSNVSINQTVDLSSALNGHNTIDLSNVGTFSTSDMRDMFAIQRYMEGLMIYGSRYIEVLQGMYGTSPTDARLQLPERLGGATFNIKVSEVLQTSESTTNSPQGNQTGHGLGVAPGHLFGYKAEEPGFIFILADIQPPAVYENRFPRELFRKSLLDQFSPYFVNLSFQAINNREIFGQLTADDDGIWAYQGRYDEMRERQSYVSGQLLDTMAYYLQKRTFNSLPVMNSDFISCDPDDSVFSVMDEDKFICNFYWELKAMRPMPKFSEPGLIDHVYGGL